MVTINDCPLIRSLSLIQNIIHRSCAPVLPRILHADNFPETSRISLVGKARVSKLFNMLFLLKSKNSRQFGKELSRVRKGQICRTRQIPRESYLSGHDALPLGDKSALGTHAIPPSAVAFVPLKRGHDSVITTSCTLGGPLIPLGTGAQEKRGRQHMMLLLLLLVLHQLAHVDAETDAAGQRHDRRSTLTTHSSSTAVESATVYSKYNSLLCVVTARSPRAVNDPGRARSRVFDDTRPHVEGTSESPSGDSLSLSLSLSLRR